MICQRLSRLPMCAGDCVGIAFQSLKAEEAENIGYVIPTPVLQHFLVRLLSDR